MWLQRVRCAGPRDTNDGAFCASVAVVALADTLLSREAMGWRGVVSGQGGAREACGTTAGDGDNGSACVCRGWSQGSGVDVSACLPDEHP